MKILLLGEFSSLHTNLKSGLIELGHDVTIASSGDGWKSIARDIDLDVNCRLKLIKNILLRWYHLKHLKSFKNYDVVQIINPFVIPNKFFPILYYFKYLNRNNHKVFLCAAGNDAYFWQIGKYKLSYSPLDDFLKYDHYGEKYYMQGRNAFKINQYIANLSNGIIPSAYEYKLGYENNDNLKDIVTFPLNLDNIKYKKNIIKDKIVIFHGLNRYGFKGTKYVEEAFNILNNKYPDELDLIIKGNMPLNEYLHILDKSNIVIDQVNSYSWAMNALYAMAQGKVVLGGSEVEVAKVLNLNIDDIPIINIKPNVNDIVEKIEHT